VVDTVKERGQGAVDAVRRTTRKAGDMATGSGETTGA
jgi:hypothetical protein